MNKWMIGVISMAGLLLAFGSGCTSVRGVKPVQPKFGQVVSDLNPLLEWEADPAGDVTYDLSITEKSGKGFSKKSKYYREGLAGTSHQVEGDALEPKTLYTWSLRPRKGEETGEWNKREQSLFLLLYYHRSKRSFEFQTP